MVEMDVLEVHRRMRRHCNAVGIHSTSTTGSVHGDRGRGSHLEMRDGVDWAYPVVTVAGTTRHVGQNLAWIGYGRLIERHKLSCLSIRVNVVHVVGGSSEAIAYGDNLDVRARPIEAISTSAHGGETTAAHGRWRGRRRIGI